MSTAAFAHAKESERSDDRAGRYADSATVAARARTTDAGPDPSPGPITRSRSYRSNPAARADPDVIDDAAAVVTRPARAA